MSSIVMGTVENEALEPRLKKNLSELGEGEDWKVHKRYFVWWQGQKHFNSGTTPRISLNNVPNVSEDAAHLMMDPWSPLLINPGGQFDHVR